MKKYILLAVMALSLPSVANAERLGGCGVEAIHCAVLCQESGGLERIQLFEKECAAKIPYLTGCYCRK